jgi:hypothetical protein
MAGPKPIENASIAIPKYLATLKWPSSWNNTKNNKVSINMIIVGILF